MAQVVGFDKSVKKRFTCDNCGAIVEYMKGDIKEYHGRDISGGADGREWVDCPNCGEGYTLKAW